MDSSYNYWLVVLSLILAVTASFAALSIASRIPHVDSRRLWIWIVGGSISMGLAIWSMHFVGMLAFHIDVELAYDIPLTGLSILYAVCATGAALIVVSSGFRNIISLLVATFFLGTGIAAMHYTGMEALRMYPAIIYDQFLFVSSLLIAYVASFVAMRLFFSEADDPVASHSLYNSRRLAAAVLMGIAISGMHYTAMEAAIFSPDAICGALGNGIDSGIMSILVILGVILIISSTLLLLMLDTKYEDNKRLIQSERRVRQVIDSAPQGMVVTDEAGVMLQVNSSMESMFGYLASDLIGKMVDILLPMDMRKNHINYRKDFAKDPKLRPMGRRRHLTACRKDGSEFPVEVGLSPIESGDQKLILATVADITHRQLLERQLEEKRKDLEDANQRVLLATESAEIGIYEYNLAGNTLIWDDRMFQIYGISPDEFDNTYESWEVLVHPDDLDTVKNVLNLAVQGHKPFDTNFRIITSNSDIRWIKANGIITYDDKGAPLRMIGINQDVTDKIEKEELIWQQANYDTLTFLPNRKLFHELLQQEIKEAHRDKRSLWVLFLDLDGFKEINDTLGHHSGDALLVLVSERIKSTLREADIIARLGGDEFVVVLSSASDVNAVASKLVHVISKSYELREDEVHISASIGIANYPGDADNATDLLKYADQSMYSAKREGKNRFVYFTPDLQKASLERVEISSALRRAIQDDEFLLYYQPIVNLDTNKVNKAEALIRWDHPDKGLVSPAEFIPIAEETGIISDISLWVFDAAFKQLQTWKSQLGDNFQLSINMSPSQLKITENKYDNWLNRLSKFSLTGNNIVIEITEGLLLNKNKVVTDRLMQYRDAGVQVAIDDFGTGYSSLAYLKEFDIDYLKIDQSFIRNLSPGSSEHSLSEAIVVMAHKLGLKVIAEGVETQQQRELLKEMGCDYGQGYLFSKPLPKGEFEKTILNSDSRSIEMPVVHDETNS